MTKIQYTISNSTAGSTSLRVTCLALTENTPMKLLGQELSFDVNFPTLPCGEKNAFFFFASWTRPEGERLTAPAVRTMVPGIPTLSVPCRRGSMKHSMLTTRPLAVTTWTFITPMLTSMPSCLIFVLMGTIREGLSVEPLRSRLPKLLRSCHDSGYQGDRCAKRDDVAERPSVCAEVGGVK